MGREAGAEARDWISRIAGLEVGFLSGVELGRREKISLDEKKKIVTIYSPVC